MDDQNYLPPERPPRKPGQEPSSKLTLDAYVRMRKELEGLKGEGRTNMAERLLRAREFGDIMENAEYDAAKNEQGLMEARIRSLPGPSEGFVRITRASPVESNTRGSSDAWDQRNEEARRGMGRRPGADRGGVRQQGLERCGPDHASP